MRVFVKDMSGNFLHATTPRKARLLLKEKKAVIESQDPFTIRLLFPASECGMKDSKPSNKNTSGLLLPEKDNTMCNNELLYKEMHEDFYDFIQRSVDQILSNPNHMKATWYRDINPACDGGIPESFAYFLFCDASVKIAKQNGIMPGNFMITGKQGFDILKSLGEPRFKWDEENNFGVLDGMMKVYYIKSMNENKFIMSIHEDREEYEDRGMYEKHYEGYKETNQFVVGEIVDSERQNENIEAESKTNDKCETVSINSIKWDSKTHLIFGATDCGKTTKFRQLIQEKLNRDEDVFVFGTQIYGRLYFSDKSNNKLHFYSPKDVSSFSSKAKPEDLAEYIVNFYYSVAGKDNTRTIAIDGFEQFKLNQDYTTSEYFRELARECRANDINFIYTLGVDSDKKESYHKLPEIYERFSDVITVLK